MFDQVRKPLPSEREAIAEFLRRDHLENGIAPLNEASMYAAIDRCLANDGAAMGVIGEPGGLIRASIALVTVSHWYSDDGHIEDYWNYVLPEFRKSTYGRDLLKWARRVSDGLGIPLVLGVYSTTRLPAKIALYSRLIGPMVGAAFRYDPDSAAGE